MDTYQLTLYKQKTRNSNYLLKNYQNITAIKYDDQGRPFYSIKDSEKVIYSNCFSCKEPKCMHFSKEELNFDIINEFPSDLEHSVCPSQAITWSIEDSSPSINSDLCISCALCIERCDFGAISFNELNIAEVNSFESEHYEEVEYDKETFNEIQEHFNSVDRDNYINEVLDGHLQNVYSKINEINSKLSLQFPNLISRNLLIILGMESVIRRRGDVNIRMDLLFSDKSTVGVSEVEFGNDILNSPRNILDNIAVLHSRYNTKKEDLCPLIISYSLPNKRSEYWNVIADIKEVTEYKVYSITLGALLIILWNRKKLDIEKIKEFYTDYSSYSIRSSLEKVLDNTCSISEGELNILEANK
ncbi:4Fe-4S binding protein [Arcobacter sp. LA11]|uniref:4Fe-4S binding protein n=1 Tax=Arcobacter sp. LA11 TaxID=1898176 RepID=UPI000933B93A|nr:4Fe-4S binding protein [Arcobacter sp. LA11]